VAVPAAIAATAIGCDDDGGWAVIARAIIAGVIAAGEAEQAAYGDADASEGCEAGHLLPPVKRTPQMWGAFAASSWV
jgi:hypothetical protein